MTRHLEGRTRDYREAGGEPVVVEDLVPASVAALAGWLYPDLLEIGALEGLTEAEAAYLVGLAQVDGRAVSSDGRGPDRWKVYLSRLLD